MCPCFFSEIKRIYQNITQKTYIYEPNEGNRHKTNNLRNILIPFSSRKCHLLLLFEHGFCSESEQPEGNRVKVRLLKSPITYAKAKSVSFDFFCPDMKCNFPERYSNCIQHQTWNPRRTSISQQQQNISTEELQCHWWRDQRPGSSRQLTSEAETEQIEALLTSSYLYHCWVNVRE